MKKLKSALRNISDINICSLSGVNDIIIIEHKTESDVKYKLTNFQLFLSLSNLTTSNTTDEEGIIKVN